jgi:DNA-binding response OmpR family regulator
MTRKPNLKGVAILIVDSDTCLARAAIGNLRAIGFHEITHVKSVDAAMKAMRSQLVTLVMTDWDMSEGASGLDLVHYLRNSPESPSRAMPIVMLTGRGELSDVEAARDVGITEFVVKPFSAQTLFSRLEQVVDNPRNFVISQAFVGPERRRRDVELPRGMEDRRSAKQYQVPFSHDAIRQQPGETPLVVGPDTSFRETLGLNASTKLASLIPPDLLKEAQKSIDFLTDDSLQWIRDDIENLNKYFTLMQYVFSLPALENVKKTTLSIKSRAGTFGYVMASEVARLLFLFLTRNFNPANPTHFLVIEKHIEVLTVIFAKKIKVREGLGEDLYIELERLISVHK